MGARQVDKEAGQIDHGRIERLTAFAKPPLRPPGIRATGFPNSPGSTRRNCMGPGDQNQYREAFQRNYECVGTASQNSGLGNEARRARGHLRW